MIANKSYYVTTATLTLHQMPSSEQETIEEIESFWPDILKPGSSLNPTFLAALDGIFAALLLVLLSLAYLTSGNPHLFALTGIELGLWASVKW